MNLAEMRGAYIDDGYGYEAASTRSCQDEQRPSLPA